MAGLGGLLEAGLGRAVALSARFLTAMVFAALTLLLLIIAGVGWSVVRQDSQSRMVQHSFLVERHVSRLLSLAQDAETSQRGYLLTGRESYLTPYNAVAPQVQAELDEVARLVADNPRQNANIAMLRRLMADKFAELELTIAQARAGARAKALATVRTDEGKISMDRLRGAIATMRAEEDRLLAVRLKQTADTGGQIRIITLISAILVLALGVLILLATRRFNAGLVASRDEVAAKNAALLVEMNARRAAEQQLVQAQKMEAVGQLTGGIAHDFNNMLAVVIGALSILKRRMASGDLNVQQFADAALDGAQRAASLTQRLLAFSRQQPLTPQILDVNRMVGAMSELLHRALGEHIELQTVLAAGLWRTRADPSQVENSILNLAVNARDAMDDGGKITIETANCHLDDAYAASELGVPAGQYVLIAVSDTGPGMAPDVLARAFDPFFTTKPVGKGTGLGLSQVHGFVKQSGGHIRIYSEPGAGTVVKMYLPRALTGGETADDARDPARGETPVDPTTVILVVEDDEHVRLVTVASLRDIGYLVVHAARPSEALRLLENQPRVDLLFTDVVMPEMNGRKLADEVLKLRPDVRVLFTTGYTQNAIVHNGILDPGTDLLMKPYSVDQLAAKVAGVLAAG